MNQIEFENLLKKYLPNTKWEYCEGWTDDTDCVEILIAIGTILRILVSQDLPLWVRIIKFKIVPSEGKLNEKKIFEGKVPLKENDKDFDDDFIGKIIQNWDKF